MDRMINSAEPFFSSRSSIRRSIDVIATYAIAKEGADRQAMGRTRVLGEIHLRHAARSKRRHDSVMGQRVAGGEGPAHTFDVGSSLTFYPFASVPFRLKAEATRGICSKVRTCSKVRGFRVQWEDRPGFNQWIFVRASKRSFPDPESRGTAYEHALVTSDHDRPAAPARAADRRPGTAG